MQNGGNRSDRPWRRGYTRRGAGAGITLALIVGLAGGSNAQETARDLRDQREDNRRDAAEVAAELDALSAEDAELLEALAAIDEHIALQEVKVAASVEAIAAAEEESDEARRLAGEIGEEIDGVRDRLRRRAVEVFVGPNNQGYTELDTADLAAASVREALLEQVVGNEYELVDELRTKVAEQAEAERVAQELVAAVETERADLEARLDELDKARQDAEVLRAQIDERVSEWQAVGAQLEAADLAIMLEIQRLEAEAEAERRVAEEEARRQAQEEAARLAAEEAALAVAEAAEPEESTDTAVEESDGAADPESDAETVEPVATGDFVLSHRPVPGVMTSPFGDRVHPIFGTVRTHYGIDFDGDRGDSIIAAGPGVVLSSGWRNGYGNTVVISHGNGFTTLYAHMTDPGVSAGQSVSGGDTIGTVGSTGWSTGPHLHFEVRVEGIAVDPGPYLP